MNSQPTFLALTYFELDEFWPYYQKDVNQISLNHTALWNFMNIWGLSSNFADCESFLESNSWHSCSMWEKLGWLNWFWEFPREGLSSFNPKGFYYSYAWSCFLWERRTSFYSGLISRKLCRFSLIFSTGFTSLSVLFLFSLLITFLCHYAWFNFI